MADLLSLPCTRCGRPARLVVGESATALVCTRCSAGAVRYVIQAGNQTLDLDGDAVFRALDAGQITALDWAARVGEASRPIAAHPDFRARFMSGGERRDAPSPARVARRGVDWRGMLRGMVVLVLLAAIGGVAWLWVERGPSWDAVKERVRATVAPLLPGAEAEEAAGASIGRLDPREQPPIQALLARVGPVEEPRALLVAQAWAARTGTDPAALDAALGLAERAVARAPESPEALALLAEILAEQGRNPKLRASLVEVARSVAPAGVEWRRAAAAAALADGKFSEAAEHLTACLTAAPDDLPCRFLDVRLSAVSKGAAALSDFDALGAAWPENLRIDRSAAIFAAQVDAPDAVARVERARSRARSDVELDGATALLRFRDGAVAQARTLAARVGDRASADLALTAGEAAIVAGAAGDAVRWAERAQKAVLTPAQGDRARLIMAQARYLQARAEGAAGAEAQAAAAELAKVDSGSPASAQARALIASLGGEAPGEVWAGLDAKGADPIDVHRAWLTRASLALARGNIKDALAAAEQARAAAPHEAGSYLWSAAASLAGADAGTATEQLRRGVLAADARATRRNPVGGALPVPAEFETIRAKLQEVLGTRARKGDGLAFAKAAASMLGGDGQTALAEYPRPQQADGAAGIALVARACLLTKNPSGAIDALGGADRSMAEEPGLAVLRAEAARDLGATGPAVKAALTVLLGTSPRDAYYHALKAELARIAGDGATARVEAELASRADPRDSEARRLYRALLSSGA